MEKIYSRLNKKNLLHIVSHNININDNRVDLTDEKLPLQVSRINLKNSVIKPHYHNLKQLHPNKIEPNECWVVMNGKLEISLYDTDKSLIENKTLIKGSILVTLSGGHSINSSSLDSEMVEIKLGPYENNGLKYY